MLKTLLASLASTLIGAFVSLFDMIGVITRFRFGRCLKLKFWVPLLIPLLVAFLFLSVFQLANPVVSQKVAIFWQWVGDFGEQFVEFIPSGSHLFFWFAAGIVTLIFFYPQDSSEGLIKVVPRQENLTRGLTPGAISPMAYWTAVNTLITLNLLFLAYNATDIRYMWLDEFPVGMNLNQYAHDGTFWLTVALAMTSGLLSLIFRDRINFSANAKFVRILAWIWLAQNVILAVNTYYRLGIYIGFNGLTFLRILGGFGIAMVVAGLVIVALKIAHQKSFWWMIRRQLLVMCLGCFILHAFPRETLEKYHNTAMILENKDLNRVHPAAYQILGQRLTDAGIPGLVPLLGANNIIIREGVAALLLQEEVRILTWQKEHPGWRYFQISTKLARQAIEAARPDIFQLLQIRKLYPSEIGLPEIPINVIPAKAGIQVLNDGFPLSRE